jgi:transcription initiation factor TFIIB
MTIGQARCQRCGKRNIISDSESGEIICGSCGLVISERIEESGPEHRIFLDGGPDRSRTGDATSLRRHDRGLATIINPSNKDASGKSLSASMKMTIGRLRTWDSRTQSHKSTSRNFMIAFTELGRLKDKLALSDAVIEKTAYIYRKALEKGLVRGRSISALIAAAVYAACRDAETPRTINDISKVSNVKRKELGKCYRKLVQDLDLKMPVIDVVQCVPRIASRLGISEKTKRYAIKMIKDYQQGGEIAGKSPMGIAATAIYLASVVMNENLTQKDVAEAANITEVTIRNRGASMKKALNLFGNLNQKSSNEEVKQ